jgi:hypothetical protein
MIDEDKEAAPRLASGRSSTSIWMNGRNVDAMATNDIAG